MIFSRFFGNGKINDIKQWYGEKRFSESYIKKFQKVVKTKEDGIVGKKTIQSVYAWQAKNQLVQDGKFGEVCANKAGITEDGSKAKQRTPHDRPATRNTSVTTGATGAPRGGERQSATSGKGINSKPGFQKQTDYPVSPYVSRSDYDKMKKAVNGAPYASWNIAKDPKLSPLYRSAVRSNKGGKSTIASSGCGVTSLANLKGTSPLKIAEMSMKSGQRVYGAGTAPGLFSSNGGRATGQGSKAASEALNQVAAGKYLICSMGKGNWCRGSGHFILVYGFDGAHVYVSDPNSHKPGRAKATKELFKQSYKYGFLF